MTHNSASTGSAKWSGSWGVAGGRYGEIICATCHTDATANIKLIKDAVITAPNTPTNRFPAEIGGVAPAFTRVSGTAGTAGVMGDDSTNPRTSSNKICEVCHTYDATAANGTKYHAYSGGINNPAHQNNATDCTGCHKHNQGFKAPACDTCHGNPPTAASLGGPTGLANSPNTTGSATAGAHNAHAVTLGYGCSNCHNNQNMPQTSTAKPGFGDISIGFSNFGSTTGTYTGQLNVSYNNTLGTGTKTCSTNYCHGTTINGPNTAAVWDALSGSLSCASAPNGACHNSSASNPPTIGAHQRHAASGIYNVTKQGLNVACTDCHGATAGTQGHVSGNVYWKLSTTNPKFSGTSTYNALNEGTTAGRAPSGTYQSCNNIYCHSTVTGDGGTAGSYVASPAWNSTTTCASCHRDQTALYTGKHQTHTATPYSYACATCHNGAGAETTKHSDQVVDVSINTTYGGTYAGSSAPGDAYSTCSSVYCHGNFTGGLNASPNWGGTAACGTCHGAAAATPPSNVNHPRHAGSGAGQLALACTKCHPARAPKDGHQDLNVQWDLDRLDAKLGSTAAYRALELGSTGAKAPSGTYGTCTNVYCHSSVQANPGNGAPTYATTTWGAASVTCDSCHGQGTGVNNGAPSTGSHETHVTTYSYACSICHSGLGDEVASHANGTINLAFDAATAGGSAAYSRTNSITPQSGTFGTCATTFCHGDSSNTSADTGTWGTSLSAADACTVCHGTKTTAADGGAAVINRAPGGNGTGVDTSGTIGTITRNVSNDTEVGAHDAHLRALTGISSAIACTECHALPAVSVAGIKGHLDGTPANMTWGTLATTGSAPGGYNATTHTCSNVYCHNESYFPTSNHTNGGTGLTPVWNNQSYFTDNVPPLTSTECGRCHFYDGSDCSGCHTHVNADDLSFGTAALHVNGTIEATGGDCTGCHNGAANDAANTDIGNNGVRAIVPEFSKQSHHVSGRAATKFDCVVCHGEGDVATGNTNTSHKNGQIDLRNVDNATATFIWTGTEYYNLNNHCLSCHDSNGASIVRNADPAVTTESATNPFGSGLTNTYDQQVRTAVVDVRTQFATGTYAWSTTANTTTLPTGFTGTNYNGNASQHAVLGPRYATNVITAAKWVATTLLGGQAPRDNVRVFCGDCHTVGSATIGAHGGNNEYMLKNSSGTDAEYTGGTNDNCFICHASASYNGTTGSTHGPANGGDYAYSNGDTGAARGSADGNLAGSACLDCHSGGTSGWGGIHGATGTYTDGGGGTQTKYRFFPGFGNRGYIPVGGWTGTDVTCYTPGTAIGGTTWSACSQHTGGVTKTGKRNGRATTY